MADVDTITISGAGRSVTVSSEALDKATKQLDLFPVDKTACAEFLTQVLTIEDEMDRLREELHDAVGMYTERLHIRAVRTAIKVVRARKKLAEHLKEPMGYDSQAKLEAFVAGHLAALDQAKQEAAREAEQAAQRPVPDMTRG